MGCIVSKNGEYSGFSCFRNCDLEDENSRLKNENDELKKNIENYSKIDENKMSLEIPNTTNDDATLKKTKNCIINFKVLNSQNTIGRLDSSRKKELEKQFSFDAEYFMFLPQKKCNSFEIFQDKILEIQEKCFEKDLLKKENLKHICSKFIDDIFTKIKSQSFNNEINFIKSRIKTKFEYLETNSSSFQLNSLVGKGELKLREFGINTIKQDLVPVLISSENIKGNNKTLYLEIRKLESLKLLKTNKILIKSSQFSFNINKIRETTSNQIEKITNFCILNRNLVLPNEISLFNINFSINSQETDTSKYIKELINEVIFASFKAQHKFTIQFSRLIQNFEKILKKLFRLGNFLTESQSNEINLLEEIFFRINLEKIKITKNFENAKKNLENKKIMDLVLKSVTKDIYQYYIKEDESKISKKNFFLRNKFNEICMNFPNMVKNLNFDQIEKEILEMQDNFEIQVYNEIQNLIKKSISYINENQIIFDGQIIFQLNNRIIYELEKSVEEINFNQPIDTLEKSSFLKIQLKIRMKDVTSLSFNESISTSLDYYPLISTIIKNCRNVVNLKMNKCCFSNTNIHQISYLLKSYNLESIDLSENSLDDNQFIHLIKCITNQIKFLDLSLNNISSFGFYELSKILFKFEKLESLDIKGNKISIDQLLNITENTSKYCILLKNLNISGTLNLNSKCIPDLISHFSALKILNLTCCLSEKDVILNLAKSLVKNKSIQILHLNNCKFNSKILREFLDIMNNSQLVEIVLNSNNFIDIQTERITFWKKLKTISLQDCSLDFDGVVYLIKSALNKSIDRLDIRENKNMLINEKNLNQLVNLLNNTKLKLLASCENEMLKQKVAGTRILLF